MLEIYICIYIYIYIYSYIYIYIYVYIYCKWAIGTRYKDVILKAGYCD